ncbi:DeoR/GlpR family DNA-binding transcription regulator [Thermotalea metallivorans]|uniref:Glucitol operon repressor n=1 Tax=Thermotalea metallivorans TaxID=520762 RepID=A0A140LBT4_9FIRM|nr:DeoR/GlpR family DNA-binding transcription regulator [Thermotalea metallivorans]KXG78009.1 Glucitol operon repressor [Thermotalea metallivorans]
MFAEERLEQMLAILNETGKIVVKELSQRFGVTEDCIRKDLKILERNGFIKRTYGGAVANRQSAQNSSVLHRKNINLEAKRMIAEKAFAIIEPKETIFLDISTINILIAEKLAAGNKKVTVVTNMMDVINALANSDHVKVIGTGGVFYRELNGFAGSTAIETIEKYNLDRVLIGSVGVNVFDKSVTTFDVEDGNTKRAIINAGKQVYLIMESGKFYMDGVYKFANLFDIDTIIVDEKPDEKICEEIEKIGVNIL